MVLFLANGENAMTGDALNPEILDQARLIHKTVNLLRTQILARYEAYIADRGISACGRDLTLPQLNMLAVIRERQPVTLKHLAKALQVSAPSASNMVERLVELEAVCREQSQVDRREVLITVTPNAAEALEHMEQYILASIGELLRLVGEEYAIKWCDVYGKVHEVLMEQRADEEASKDGRSTGT
jgi:DNA-binding MarR family transcriptional regulator